MLDYWRVPLEFQNIGDDDRPNWSQYGLYRRGLLLARVAVEYLPFKARIHIVRCGWVRKKELGAFLPWLETRVREVANINKVEIFQSEKDYRNYGKK